jgi:hypothetical protein
MDIIDFFRTEQKRLHDWTREAVSDLTIEEWNHIPAGKGNSIAFLVWHSARTEDSVLRFFLQQRMPRWNEEGWDTRLAIHARTQGTGMSTHDAQSLRIDDPALFLQYAEAVWQEYETYLAAITDGGAELSARRVNIKAVGDMSALQAIGQVTLSHLFTHYGEISLLRGLLVKQGMPL